MRLSRNALAVVSAGLSSVRSRVGLWAVVGALGCVALMFAGSSGWRTIGWHAGLFCAIAAVLPETKRFGAWSFVDACVALLACLVELVMRPSLAEACIGVAASAAGWSLGRSALALTKLWAIGPGSLAKETEAAAVSWFTTLQRTPPERFDWEALERWMRTDPSHRDAYERVEAIWYADMAEDAAVSPNPLRRVIGWFSRVTAVAKFGLWLAPTYGNRALVFSAAAVLSAVAVYA